MKLLYALFQMTVAAFVTGVGITQGQLWLTIWGAVLLGVWLVIAFVEATEA